jgi:ATP-binding cassette subfamily B protein
MRHLFNAAKRYKSLIAICVFLGLTGTFLQGFSASYFQKVVDNFTDGTLTLLNIIVYCGALVILYVVNYLDNYPWRKLESGIPLNLKINALRKVSVIDYLSHTKLGTGALIQRIENGATAGSSIFIGFYLSLVSELIPSMLFSIIFVFTISPKVVVAIMIGYVIVFIVTNLLLKVLYKVKERILVNEERFNHILVRGFMEMVVFRVYRRFAVELKKAETASGEIISSNAKMKMTHEAFFTIFAVLVALIKVGVITYGWTSKSLSIGQIVALIALMDYAYQPIAIINVSYVQYKLDKVAFARYSDFMDTKDEPRLTEMGEIISEIKGNISFSEVGFDYNGCKILNDFNLDIRNGKKIAFVGESGSGKSTVVKLLVGLLRPQTGYIEVDGFNLNQINLNSYYEHIAYLPQEPSIFDGTLRENLVFDEVTDDTKLIEVIEKVGLGDMYAKLDKGLDTQLGEKGVRLSGGERQQLALARLWFSKAVIVIFDEATSAIDNITEEVVMKNVMTLLSQKTVIAIAHRLDSIKSFDNIFVFQDGRIMEQGSFNDLIEKHEFFYELYNRSKTE